MIYIKCIQSISIFQRGRLSLKFLTLEEEICENKDFINTVIYKQSQRKAKSGISLICLKYPMHLIFKR